MVSAVRPAEGPPHTCAPEETSGMHERVTERPTDVETELALFSFFLAETPDRVYFKDREGRFVRASSATARFFAVPLEELIGMTALCFFAPESAQESHDEELRIVETGEPHLDL